MPNYPRDGYLGPLFILYSRICSRYVAVRIFRGIAAFFFGYSLGLWFWNLPFAAEFLRSLERQGDIEINNAVDDLEPLPEIN